MYRKPSNRSLSNREQEPKSHKALCHPPPTPTQPHPHLPPSTPLTSSSALTRSISHIHCLGVLQTPAAPGPLHCTMLFPKLLHGSLCFSSSFRSLLKSHLSRDAFTGSSVYTHCSSYSTSLFIASTQSDVSGTYVFVFLIFISPT